MYDHAHESKYLKKENVLVNCTRKLMCENGIPNPH